MNEEHLPVPAKKSTQGVRAGRRTSPQGARGTLPQIGDPKCQQRSDYELNRIGRLRKMGILRQRNARCLEKSRFTEVHLIAHLSKTSSDHHPYISCTDYRSLHSHPDVEIYLSYPP
jgi:hypothetical protein